MFSTILCCFAFGEVKNEAPQLWCICRNYGQNRDPVLLGLQLPQRLHGGSMSQSCGICLLLSKDGEHGTECKKVQCLHLLIELFQQEENIVLASRGFNPAPQQTKLQQHLVLEGTRHLEGRMTSGGWMNLVRTTYTLSEKHTTRGSSQLKDETTF